MGKVRIHEEDRKKYLELERELWKTLEHLREQGVLRQFLSKLFTESEIEMFARRIQATRLILQSLPMLQVRARLGLGQATAESVLHRIVRHLSPREREVLVSSKSE